MPVLFVFIFIIGVVIGGIYIIGIERPFAFLVVWFFMIEQSRSPPAPAGQRHHHQIAIEHPDEVEQSVEARHDLAGLDS